MKHKDEKLFLRSKIPDDVAAIVASYGPTHRESYYIHTVKGVQVSPLRSVKTDDRNVNYQLCIFPDYSQRWVNAGNIRSRKISKYGEIYEQLAA